MNCFRVIISELSIIKSTTIYTEELEIEIMAGISPLFFTGQHFLVFENNMLKDIIWIFEDILILTRLPTSPLSLYNNNHNTCSLDNLIILYINGNIEYGFNFIEKTFLIELFEITDTTYTFVRANIKPRTLPNTLLPENDETPI